MKKRIIKNFLLSIIGFSIFILIGKYCKPDMTSNNKFYIYDIRHGFNGVVIESIALRPHLYTHIKLSRFHQKDTIIGFGNIKDINIGDSIIKNANSPYYYVIKKGDSLKQKHIFTYISQETIHSSKWNPAWNKYLSNEWKEAVVKDKN